jgi:hypothetical protein
MARRSNDQQTDRLYQLPLSEFTPARNALAKELGGEAGKQVRTLPKPSTSAWAVNQLYWRDRGTYDALVTASEKLRAAHRAVLGGRKADLRAADAEHREALKAALTSTLRLLGESDQNVSSAAQTEIARTLESLPVAQPAGRLSKPLQPGGFEALQGMPVRGQKAPAPAAREKEKPQRDDNAALERERKQKQRALEEAERQKRWYRAAVTRLQKRVEGAERATATARDAWERAQEALTKLRHELRDAEKSLERAASDMRRLTTED